MSDVVDVSNWQAGLDLAVVKAAGYVAAIAKASERTDFLDPLHATFRAQAEASGLVFGSYHFGRPDLTTPGDFRSVVTGARREAEWFLAAAKPKEGEIVALDVERLPLPHSAAEVALWIATWLDEVEEATGQRPLLYTNPNFWQTAVGNSTGFGAYPLWLASWGTTTPTPLPGWSTVSLHQFTSEGKISGYTGNLDLNRIGASVDIAALQIGAQPTTKGDPYAPPYTLRFGDSIVATATQRGSAFTDGIYNEVHKRGRVTLEATRRMA